MERGAIDTVAARGRVIESYLPMAVHAARRYSGRGEPLADLVQVAVIGLMKAVDRFDADRGVAFASYAMPTIFGEIKRHFRDTTWTVRVPRSAQELNAQVAIVREDMAHRLYRMPTTPEIAARLHVSERDVLSAQRSAHAYRPLSFEQVSPYGEGLRLGDSLGDLDEQIEVVSDRETLRLCLSVLSEREQRIIGLRFFAGMTQLQIADDIGVSQMQISRLLTRSLAHLRDVMLDDTPPPGERPSPRRQPSGAQ
jgi:RNA polymerase sigma-B factor